MRKKERYHFCNGQSLVEYVILIAIVTAVLAGMNFYAKTSIQGVIKAAADQAGTQTGAMEYADLSAKTDTKETDFSHGVTRERTMLGGNYVTDVNESALSDVYYGHSESETYK